MATKVEAKVESMPKEENKYETVGQSNPLIQDSKPTPEPELISFKAPAMSEAELRKFEEMKNFKKAGKLNKI